MSQVNTLPATKPAVAEREQEESSDSQRLWYKDATIYQTHVRAFYDSGDDGIGDFAGLTQKLDYLQDLGVTTVWLLPFYPSPLRDDGYDIADYTDVNPAYGTLDDFKTFLHEAHARGLKVITELVLNHTSDQHPWFQRARRAKPGSVERDFYVWSDTPEKYQDARIIFKDFETSNWSWDPLAKAYYWHRFYSHQPDLNFENPAVQEALFKVLEYWLEMGVDGLRLDAVPYLYEREGTNCENLPETHEYLKSLRRHIDERFANRMLLAEANQWPEDAIAYFGNGDECHAAFHFPVMPRMFMAIHMEDRFPIIDILQQTPAIPPDCQWFVFLRNHDELTLEMVTDEERDTMYRVYAHDRQARINLGIRRRLAPLLGNNRRKIELMNGLLFALPGTPVIYYGDEIGMGDNIYLGDRDGVRTPMQWSADRNAGFSRANPQKLYLPVIIDSEYLFESVNVETQRKNPESLWWWMKRLIALRQHYPALSRGTLDFLTPENPKVLAFVRTYEGQSILVVANLSRHAQYAELDLSAYEGARPRELFGHVRFPDVTKQLYTLSLTPHAFFWFNLRSPAQQVGNLEDLSVSKLSVHSNCDELFRGRGRTQLQDVLARWIVDRRWYGGKARTIQGVSIVEDVALATPEDRVRKHLVLLKVEYTEGEPDTYSLPLRTMLAEEAERVAAQHPEGVIARIYVRDTREMGILFEAVWDPQFGDRLLEAVLARRRVRGEAGEIICSPSRLLESIADGQLASLAATVPRAEQSNTSIIYGDKLILKLFRRIEPGMNPDLEIGRFLTKVGFPYAPEVVGAVEYRPGSEEPLTLAIMHMLVPNSITAWKFTLDALGRYVEQVMALDAEARPTDQIYARSSLLELADGDAPESAKELIGGYLESAALLGQRTAQLHIALASDPDNPSFAPEPFSQLYQRSLYQSMRKLTLQTLPLLRRRMATLPPAVQTQAQFVLEHQDQLLSKFKSLITGKLHARRIRCHGDYHLGQVLYTGNDFVIIDFEGEPAQLITERRIKRSPLRDVAGMIRSFHYAASQAVFGLERKGLAKPENLVALMPAANFWYLWTSSAFLKAYLATAGAAGFLPTNRGEAQTLLDVFLTEKAVYELGYELNNRPDWVEVPLAGLTSLLETGT